MDIKLTFKFVEEIRQQCRFTRVAFRALKDCVQTSDLDRVFLHAQAFVEHACQVSRLLRPVRAESQSRGEFLRRELAAGDDVLQAVRAFRERVGTSDEWFEDWLSSMDELNYVDMNMMPLGTMIGFKEDAFQRNLDPDVLQLRLRGQVCDLPKTAAELGRIETACDRWLRTHSPW